MKRITLKKQFVLLALLWIISLGVYWNEHRRGGDFQIGQEFLKGLDITQIDKLVMRDNSGKEMIFKRMGEGFVMENLYNYPAHHGRLNDILFDLSKIVVSAKVSSDKDRHLRYSVASDKGKQTFELYDRRGQLMVKFYVGEEYKPVGRYIRKEGDDSTYVTQGGITIEFDEERYIQKTVINFDNKLLKSVKGTDYQIDRKIVKKIKEDGKEEEVEENQLLNGPIENVNQYDVTLFMRNLSNIAFDKVYVTGTKELENLPWNPHFLTLTLSDSRKIVIKGALKENGLYFTLSEESLLLPLHLPNDAPSEEIKKADEYFKLQKEISDFNLFHQNWIYQMLEGKTKILTKTYNDFLKKENQ